MDGVFDLFHYGHVRAIQQCRCIAEAISAEKEAREIQDIPEIIIGIISDSDTESYKRLPIFTIEERTEMINAIGMVDEVISPAPLIVKGDFIKENRIDIVVHGFSDDEDFEKQKGQHKELIDMGIFQRIQYTDTISTTDIINRIITR